MDIMTGLSAIGQALAVVPYVGVGRCDGHHKMVGLYWARWWQLAAVVSMSKPGAAITENGRQRHGAAFTFTSRHSVRSDRIANT
jgi:hypothetical protein